MMKNICGLWQCIKTRGVYFFALLWAIALSGRAEYELVLKKNHACMTIDLLKDGAQAEHIDLLYQDNPKAQCEIKELNRPSAK